MNVTTGTGRVNFTRVGTDGADELYVTLHRTLRLPEDGKTHKLPPSLGNFPVKQVDDYKDTVPSHWVEHGGVFIPMWQREAMWLAFKCRGRPSAIKVAAGKINAVSGKPWKQELQSATSGDKQDYMVAPPQPWLDGFNVGDGVIKQFVAMPLGQGYTVEKQITGKEDVGGVQICCFFPKKGLLELKKEEKTGGRFHATLGMTPDSQFLGETKSLGPVYSSTLGGSSMRRSRGVGPSGQSVNSGGFVRRVQAAEMGLAAGGSMRQQIYPDPHGIDVWNQDEIGRCFIHIVNSQMYEQITGEKAPATPIDAQTYAKHGYPWFDLYDEHLGDVEASKELAGVKTVSEMDKKKDFVGQQDDSPIEENNVVMHKVEGGKPVRNGTW